MPLRQQKYKKTYSWLLTKKPKTFLIYDVPSTIFDYIAYLKETEIKTELFKLNYLICIIQIKVVSLQRFLECIMLQIENYGKNN